MQAVDHRVVPDAVGPIRTLVLDDDAMDRSRIRRLSARSDLVLEIDEVPTIAAMAQAIDRVRYDLVLVDYHLTDGSGLEALNTIRAHQGNGNTAVIMVSGQDVQQVMAPAFRGGAQDFLSKDDMSPVDFRISVMEALRHAGRLQVPDRLAVDVLQLALQRALPAALGEAFADPVFRKAMQAALRGGIHGASQSPSSVECESSDRLLTVLLAADRFDFQR